MARKRTDRPNVIVFFTDQQRWDTTGIHGNPLELTPNFDRMARRGTDVHYSYTCQPVCGPARACLQTGMYATNTGVFHNGIPLPQHLNTLAKCFNAGGYATGYIGKWHLGSRDPVPPEERAGYQEWLASNLLEFTSDAYDTVMFDGAGRRVKLPGYRVDALTDAAIRYVDAHQEEPFFLFISYLEPHHQNHIDDYPPPDGYRERYTGRWTPPDLAALGGSSAQHLGGYYGMVKRLDEALGRLLDALKSLGLDEDTVVLYTSDHGCHFKTRNAEYKRSCHESAARVPTAICGPGFNGKGRVEQLVSLVDLPPTLLDAAGLPIPASMEGRSLLPLLNGQATDWPEEVFIQISESQVGRAIRTRRWKYGVNAPDKHGSRDPGSDHYVEQYLYDLESDPYELQNLVGQEALAAVAAELRERLIARMVAAGEAAPTITPAPAVASGQRATTIQAVRDRYLKLDAEARVKAQKAHP
ncbi:MAG TPA: sulfatase-like hydrolase/transferase [Caldilineaceae bacterium]|nr:sulfatase-like hydrolase/transferase [Caldilineaceae bacterium]